MTHRGIGNNAPGIAPGIGSPLNKIIKGIGGGRPDAFVPVEDRIFQFKINSGAGKVFQLPLYSGGDYDFTVLDWGDGDTDDITAWNDAAVSHTYPLANTDYIITIQRKLKGFNFDLAPTGTANKDKILDVQKAGCLQLLSGGASFFDCSNLIWSATDEIPNLPTDMRWTWELCVSMTVCQSPNASDWSGVLQIEGLFDSDILLNQQFNLNTTICTNYKFAFWGLAAQDKSITLTYAQADIVQEMISECPLFNHPISFGNSKISNAKGFLKNSGLWNQNISNMGWENMSDLETAEGFIENTDFDRDADIPISNSASDGINLKKFFKNTPLGDRTITINFNRVDDADNMFDGCFSQSVVSWSDFLVDLQDQLLNLNNNVRIDAEAQHNQAGHDAIAEIVSTRNWIINDGGHGHP